MIFSTVAQTKIFFCLLYGGMIYYAIYFIFSVFFVTKNKNKLTKNIYLIFNSLFFGLIFIIFINIFNFGRFHIFLLGAYTLGYVWCRITFRKLLDFLSNRWYNLYCQTKTRYIYQKAIRNGSIKDN